MKLEFIIKCFKGLIISIIESLLSFVLTVIFLYYFLILLLKIIYSCLSFFYYLIKIISEHYLKVIVDHSNTLCFDLLRGVYEQNPNVKSVFDINPFWEKKIEPRFDSCGSGLITVLSRHCNKLMISNHLKVFNQENQKEMALSFGDCVSTLSSVINDYCGWTETNVGLAQKSNINSLFGYFTFIGSEQHSFKEGSSFEKCEKELSYAISHKCDWLVTMYKPESIKLGFIFDNFETVCFEQQKHLSVKLCVDGLYSVVTHNCALVKWHYVIINNVPKLSELYNVFEENVWFVALFVAAGYFFYLAVVYIYEKWCHYFFYNNDFLKKYPQNNIDTIVVKDNNGNQEDTIIELMNGNPPEFNVLGLDCEIASGTERKPCPALLQLARPDGYCALFQLKHLQYNKSLEKILNNKYTLLVGVGVLNDVNNLKAEWDMKSKRCLDVRHLARDLKFKTPYSLKDLANNLFGVKCQKNVKHGPWEELYLTSHQINYAAQDARLSIQIFMELNNRKIHQKFSWIERLLWSEKTYWKHTLTLWERFIDKTYDQPHPYPLNKPSVPHCLPSDDFRSNSTYSYIPECNPPPPYTINMMIHHRVCVVCGSTDDREISLKAIVPLEYRVQFSRSLPHYLDLCKNCIIKNQKEDFELRNYLADVSGSPYATYINKELLTLKMITKTILQLKKPVSTEQQVVKIVSVVREMRRLSEQLGVPAQKLTLKNLEILSNMDCWPFSDCPHADAVSNFVNQNFTGTDKMRRIWCDHFVHTMRPAFLPKPWKEFYRREELLQQPYI